MYSHNKTVVFNLWPAKYLSENAVWLSTQKTCNIWSL